MANEFKQRVCNARDLKTTLNDIGEPWVIRLENNDDMLVCWYEKEETP